MADNVAITAGSGTTVAADEVVDGTLGTVKVQYVKLMDGTLDGTSKAVVNANGLKVDGSGVTQPISGTVTTTPPTDATTNLTKIVGTAVDVNSGTKSAGTLRVVLATDQPALTNKLLVTPDSVALPANQSVNINQLAGVTPSLNTGVRDSGTQRVTIATNDLVPVTGTITAVTAITNPLPAGTNVIGHIIHDSGSTTVVTGTVAVTESGTWTVQPGNTANTTPWLVTQQPSILSVTATAATGVAVTATLPSVSSQFHYITMIEITKYFTAANAASATPLLVTTTNIPGLIFSFGQPLGTVGTTDVRIYSPATPLRSTAVTTATTIVCPATTGIIWRINVWYYAAV